MQSKKMQPVMVHFRDGVADAIRRLYRLACVRTALGWPDWLFEADYAVAVHAAGCHTTLQTAAALAQSMAAVAREARAAAGGAPSTGASPGANDSEHDDDGDNVNVGPPNDVRKRCALLRLILGDAMEAVALRALTDAPMSEQAAAQLYADSYRAAVWTSAHAEYLDMLDRLPRDVDPAPPSCMSVPCACSEWDLCEAFAYRVHPKNYAKDAGPLLQLLQRATSPGQRGWDSVMDGALKQPASSAIVTHSLLVCLMGLHPQLPPSLRPRWKQRACIRRVVEMQLKRRRAAVLARCPLGVKEALRRSLSTAMASSAAEHAALSQLGHPTRFLLQPPCALPCNGQRAAMAALAKAGDMLASRPIDLACAMDAGFESCVQQGIAGIRYDQSWLGKGTISVAPCVPLTDIATSIWIHAFRANFLPFWAHCASHDVRASRLDAVQHHCLHNMNAATLLCGSLTEAEALHAQRAAFRCASAALQTPRSAAHQVCRAVVPRGAALPRATSVSGGVEMLRQEGGSIKGAAQLLVYARASAVREALLVVQLGRDVAQRQARALLRRFSCAPSTRIDGDDVVERALRLLPKHATHIYFCCECRRIATAHVNDAPVRGNQTTCFNELGVSATMIARMGTLDGTVPDELRCAKRSSAALRTALATEADMTARKPELSPLESSGLAAMLGGHGSNTGISAKLRRDAKSAQEQAPKAIACGAASMLCVPVLGRAVRICDQWVALCTYCAAAVLVRPHHRYGADVACMRCDPGMLYTEAEIAAGVQSAHTRKGRVCRACGRVDPERSGARWKTVPAPLDKAGPNAALPPPLRVVSYCPRHWRSWLVDAHGCHETRVILAHICTGARPVWKVASSDARLNPLENNPAPKRRRLTGTSSNKQRKNAPASTWYKHRADDDD